MLKISDSEWEVLRVVWTNPNCDAHLVSEVLGESKNWQKSTVKTLLSRLVKKNALQTTKVSNKFIYTPLVSEEEVIVSATETLFSHICAKKIGQTIAEMITSCELTAEDYQLIQDALAQKETVETIKCNCIPGQCHCKEHQDNKKME